MSIIDDGLSNPFSSGGGGTAFEMRVAACYLVSLLREEIPRGLSGGTTQRLRFQARQQGILLDDLLVTSFDGSLVRHLALQIKHKLDFSAADPVFQAVISAAWRTYTSALGWQFTPGLDRLGIGIGAISSDVREHLITLLEWARHCLSAQEFLDKVQRSRYAHEQKRKYLSALREALEVAAERPLLPDELWIFLRHLVVLDFDLEHEGSRDATAAWNHLLDETPQRDPALARSLFTVFVEEASTLAPQAGTIDVNGVRDLAQQIVPLAVRRTMTADLRLLHGHATRVLAGIQDTLANQLYLPRPALLRSVKDAVRATTMVCITGVPGVGKSGLLRAVAQELANEGQLFLLRAGELDYPMLEGFLRDFGFQHSIDELLEGLSGAPHRCLLIDGLERALDLRHKHALNDLLNAVLQQNALLRSRGVAEQHHWKIVCTCRPSALESVLSHLPALGQLRASNQLSTIPVTPLDEHEMQEVIAALPAVQSLWQDAHLRELLHLPFLLDIVTRQKLVLSKGGSDEAATESWFAEEFWHAVIRRGDGMREGLGAPLAREQTLLELARRSLQSHRLWIPLRDLDPQAAQGLVLDQVLREEDGSVSFAHDVFEDWALSKLLAQARDEVAGEIERYREAHALDRPLQLRVCRVLESGDPPAEWRHLLAAFEARAGLSPRWYHLVLAAPLSSTHLPTLLPRLEPVLLEKDGKRLAEFLVALRSIATVPDPVLEELFQPGEERARYEPYVRVPVQQTWLPVLRLLLRQAQRIPSAALLPASDVMRKWMQKTAPGTLLRAEVASLALDLLFAEQSESAAALEAMKSDDEDKVLDNLLHTVLAGADCRGAEIERIVRQWMQRGMARAMPRAKSFVTLRDEILSPESIGSLCQYLPQLLADVTRYRLLILHQDKRHLDGLQGLGIRDEPGWFPPDQFKGPFLSLLRLHPQIGLTLVLDLTNHATQAWLARKRSTRYGGEGEKPLPQKLLLGTEAREIWGDELVWRWFRYPSVAPDAVASALAALECWLCELVERGADPKPTFESCMRRTISAAVIGTLSSVAMKFPGQCAEAALPILRCPGFWLMDQHRQLQDQVEAAIVNAPDRQWRWIRRAAQEEHRRGNLEGLALYLMLTHADFRTQLLPVIRAFPDTLPYTDERQVGDREVEARLRRICEFMVLRTDVTNFVPVDLGDGLVGFEPRVIPEHLAKAQQDSQEKETQRNELLGLRLWALHHLEGRTDDARYRPSVALAVAQRVAAVGAAEGEEPALVRERQEVAPLVAAALVCCHGSDLCQPEDVCWCRQQLLQAAWQQESEPPLGGEYARYPWGVQRSAARALPQLLSWSPQDAELRLAVAMLCIHGVHEVRQFACTALKDLWMAMPAFVWRCLCLGVGVALHELGAQEGEPGVIFATWLAGQLAKAVSDESEADPEPLGERTPLEVDWSRLECAVLLLPGRSAQLPAGWQEKLHHLYEDWLRFTIATHRVVEDPETHRLELRNVPNTWDRLFFASLARSALALPQDEAVRSFINPMLEGWEQVPAMMETFLRSLLDAASDTEPVSGNFVPLWKHIGYRLLSSGESQSSHVLHARNFEQVLALLVFADPYGTWRVERWEPLHDCVDLIEAWVKAVGHTPSCFRALLRLLSSIGFPLFTGKGVGWLSSCLEKAPSPENLLREGYNATTLAELLTKAFREQLEALLASDLNWRTFNALVDRLAGMGELGAVDLQRTIRQVRPERSV